MLNRKLTKTDAGKEFIACDNTGTEFPVRLMYLDARGFVMYHDECSSMPEACFGVDEDGICTDGSDPDNYRLGYKILKEVEIEEPEEFRLTGKEVWRAATKEQQKELDDALGVKDLNLKIDSAVFDALEEKAKQQGIILKALVRQILTDYVANQ